MTLLVAALFGPVQVPQWHPGLIAQLQGLIIPTPSVELTAWCAEKKLPLVVGTPLEAKASFPPEAYLLLVRADTDIPVDSLIGLKAPAYSLQVWSQEHYSWRPRLMQLGALTANPVGVVDPIWPGLTTVALPISLREEARLDLEPQTFLDIIYQAQRCLSQGDKSAAAKYLVTAKPSNPEEQWLVYFFRAHTLPWERAQEEYLQAYQCQPHRAEPLHNIAHYYHDKGQHHQALLFAKAAAKLSLSPHCRHYIYPDIYTQGCHHLISLSAYYANDKPAGLASINHLLLAPTTSRSLRSIAQNNLIFYLTALPAQLQVMPVDLPLLNPEQPERGRYRPYNPSIVKLDTLPNWRIGTAAYLVNCRSCNYDHQKEAYYAVDGTNVIKTRNFLLWFDAQWHKLHQIEMADAVGGELDSWVKGLEDVRLFSWRGDLWFQANHRVTADTPQIIIGRLELTSSEGQPVAVKVVEKRLLSGDKCEKNWLPYVQGEALRFIYYHSPLKIIELRTPPEPITLPEFKAPGEMGSFRGSAGPIPWGSGYLSVIHEVIFRDSGRHYHHRFIRWDAQMLPVAISKPFWFRGTGIEFVTGLELTPTGVVIGVGIDDKEAYLAHVTREAVDLSWTGSFENETQKNSLGWGNHRDATHG